MNDRFRFRVFYKPHNKIYNYKLLIVKKNETDKKYRLFCSKTPFSNEYVKIGMIDDLASIEMIKTAFKPFIGGINENY